MTASGSNNQRVEERLFRLACGLFPTGVAIVAARSPEGPPVGLTINSFASVSLAPPLVLWSLRKEASLFSVFAKAKMFAISVLAADQREIAHRFAFGREEDRFSGCSATVPEFDLPIITGSLAHFECARRHTYECGDHLILVGEVIRMRVSEGDALARFRGCYLSTAVLQPLEFDPQ